ncbi:hypothetical protein PsYK624_102220 [Phanerochaete sordida]|uniref:Uncharacterized protein n=1 Tax=Phanerochaete sordida TaxID=48140 RepID=A0A9P3GI68_9APHY|nr:hypothetical protein PsYK624_102220 [Phanerochaete sordida]
MNNSTDCTAFFAQNTDITGIGVRAAFYTQLFTLSVLPLLDRETRTSSFWTLFWTSLGLILASLVSAAEGELSFWSAVQVQYLVFISNAALIHLLPLDHHFGLRTWWKEAGGRDKLAIMFYIFHHILSLIVFIIFWILGEEFGPDTSCISSTTLYVSYKGPVDFMWAKYYSFLLYLSIIFLIGLTHMSLTEHGSNYLWRQRIS